MFVLTWKTNELCKFILPCDDKKLHGFSNSIFVAGNGKSRMRPNLVNNGVLTVKVNYYNLSVPLSCYRYRNKQLIELLPYAN